MSLLRRKLHRHENWTLHHWVPNPLGVRGKLVLDALEQLFSKFIAALTKPLTFLELNSELHVVAITEHLSRLRQLHLHVVVGSAGGEAKLLDVVLSPGLFSKALSCTLALLGGVLLLLGHCVQELAYRRRCLRCDFNKIVTGVSSALKRFLLAQNRVRAVCFPRARRALGEGAARERERSERAVGAPWCTRRSSSACTSPFARRSAPDALTASARARTRQGLSCSSTALRAQAACRRALSLAPRHAPCRLIASREGHETAFQASFALELPTASG